MRVACASRARAADGQPPPGAARTPGGARRAARQYRSGVHQPHAFWLPFTDRCHAAGIPRLSEWLNSTGRIVAEQFARRGWKRPADRPLSTSPLEAILEPIRDSIKPRASRLKNRQRTDRMLMLMQLHAQPPRRRERLRPRHPRLPRGQPRSRASPAVPSPTPAGSRRCDECPATNASPCAFWIQSARADRLGDTL